MEPTENISIQAVGNYIGRTVQFHYDHKYKDELEREHSINRWMKGVVVKDDKDEFCISELEIRDSMGSGKWEKPIELAMMIKKDDVRSLSVYRIGEHPALDEHSISAMLSNLGFNAEHRGKD